MYKRYGLSKEIYEACIDRMNNNLSYLSENSNDRELFIWGAGKLGSLVYDFLKKHSIKINGFIDILANPDSMFYDLPVVLPTKVLNKENIFYVIAITKYDCSFLDFLLDEGVDLKYCFFVYTKKRGLEDDCIYHGCHVGRGTYGHESLLKYHPMAISIGRYCSINETAHIWNNHPIDCVTTSPLLDCIGFFPIENYGIRRGYIKRYGKYHNNHAHENSELRSNLPIYIGNDVWIGANVCILPGVTIGDGAILAAGAIVNRDVPPYAVVGGVPAKVIKYRFSDDICRSLLKIKWWEWSVDRIENNIEYMYRPIEMVRAWKEKVLR